MQVALSLRWRLLSLWLVMLAISSTLAYIIHDVHQLGSETQAQKTIEQVSQACAQLQTEYTHLTKSGKNVIDIALMSALLNIVLVDMPGIEGGFWHASDGFIAYAYPTHTGNEEKKDMPSTERRRIEKLVRESLAQNASIVNMIHGNHEIVVQAACPVDFPETRIGIWTMSRSPMIYSKAYDKINRGLGLLFSFVVISGIWLGFSLHYWNQRFNSIERELGGYPENLQRDIPVTGDVELDRIVVAFNQFRARLNAEQARAMELDTLLERSERFTALGRMAATIAHEIRNPIAAMQLKAENALMQSNGHQVALEFILREIERLDATIKELLKKAEPISVHSRQVCVSDWLLERIDAFTERCAASRIKLRVQVNIELWRFDPKSLGRALDNLIANALQHTPCGGAISVIIKRGITKSTLVLQICDTGPGVAAEIESQLFEPFISGRMDGVGLGLALAREIAVAHGGDARYFRQPTGACFELEIPWHRDDENHKFN